MTPRMKLDPAECTMELSSQHSLNDDRIVKQQDTDEICERKTRYPLSRLVSQDELAKRESNANKAIHEDSSLQSETASVESMSMDTPSVGSFALQNPLNDSSVLRKHIKAVRLEADLNPLRLVLARLMSHPIHNRKGLFNHPVNPVALGLPDYHQIVTQPMDLGTVKRKLHAVAYPSRSHAMNDIRLVFVNAMRYNPPHNPVHAAAKELLSYFERYCEALGPCVSDADLAHPDPKGEETNSEKYLPNEPDGFAESGIPKDQQASQATPSTAAVPLDAKILTRTWASVSLAKDDGRSPASLPCRKNRPKMPTRSASFSQRGKSHSCEQCLGRICFICSQGCLQHEPALLVCCGSNCNGSRIRKGTVYYITKDGTHQYCDRCYIGLPSLLAHSIQDPWLRCKNQLLKRKNDEEIAEEWIICKECRGCVHSVCAMLNSHVHDESNYVCPECSISDSNQEMCFETSMHNESSKFTFLSGSDEPVPIGDVNYHGMSQIDSDSLDECPISLFIQEKVQQVMKNFNNADKTISIRVISDCDRQFFVPEVIRRYFRMTSDSDDTIEPPRSVHYRQKAIVMFQKIDGFDVCIFCMYVQEYDDTQGKRVYIAYIDSVEHFRPRQLRSQVYYEILVAYLATARERGYKTAHIWACPPSRGNCFVFWNHPASQRTPTAERLLAWYHKALSRAVETGVVTDVKSLYESHFEGPLSHLSKNEARVGEGGLRERMVCPPLIDGDFWIEESLRVYHNAAGRHLRLPTNVCTWNVEALSRSLDPCPALQIASLLKDRLMTHPSSVPFRKPVNAASMRIMNYHKIIKNPMDLSTIYSRCVLGHYQELRHVIDDFELMVYNAKKFNPIGHVVHTMAAEILNLFYVQLNILTSFWKTKNSNGVCWKSHVHISMSLDARMELKSGELLAHQCSVAVEVDRSSDESMSFSSVASMASSSMKDDGTAMSETSSSKENASQNLAAAVATRKPQCRQKGRRKTSPKPLNILCDGPEAVMQRMAGKDWWLLDKRSSLSSKVSGRKRNRSDTGDISADSKRRRQAWLCEEVSASVRRMRTSFFTCSLTSSTLPITAAEHEKLEMYTLYSSSFKRIENCQETKRSSLADARSALLELSQFRNFEFDTLRKAKYSTIMLLYHINQTDASGATAECTLCGNMIAEVRWHKAKRIREIFKSKTYTGKDESYGGKVREELCTSCYDSRDENVKNDFIPIPVSSAPRDTT